MPKQKVLQKNLGKVKSAGVSSSEDEWEDVAERNEIENPEKPVEIELDLPNSMKNQQSKKIEQAKQWISILIRRAINKSTKEIQIRMHKTHLLCLLSLGLRLNDLCCNEELQCIALSIVEPNIFSFKTNSSITKENLERLLSHLKEKFSYCSVDEKKGNEISGVLGKVEVLKNAFQNPTIKSKIDLVLVFVTVLRALGFNCRLVMSLQPIPLKPLTDKQKQARKKKVEVEVNEARNKRDQVHKPSGTSIDIKIPQLDGTCDDVSESTRSSLQKKVKPRSFTKSNKKSENPSNNKRKPSKRIADTNGDAKTLSKYIFNSDDNKSTDDNLPAAKKIGIMAKKSKNSKKKLTDDVKGPDSKVKRVCKVNLEKYSPTKHKTSEHTESSVPSKLLKQTEKFQTDLVSDTTTPKANLSRLRQQKKKAKYASESDGDFTSDESDFDLETTKKTLKNSQKSLSTPTNKRTIKGKKAQTKPKQVLNQWIEVYLKEVGWVVVNCLSGLITEPKKIEQSTSKPVHYVIGIDNKGFVKDVTVRYASDWLISTRKLRIGSVDQNWWKETLDPFKTNNRALDKEENAELEANLLSQPLPVSVSAYKNHPLYVLRRHLLKYEAIYPPDVLAVGFLKGEEILPRSSVHVLHTREKWLQSALSVKDGEVPYKMVASYILNKKLNRDSDVPSLALFGKWQTEPYKCPVATNGKVPRNEYGNVDLFQPSMLPIGCVQLRLPSLNIVARKLDIDIATAVVGFDTHHGYPHPVTDGYVVCKEYEAILREAWKEEQAHAEEKAREKLEKRVYANWKTLIRGVLALQKVRKKYSDQVAQNSEKVSQAFSDTAAWQSAKLKEAKEKLEHKSRSLRRTKKIVNTCLAEIETL